MAQGIIPSGTKQNYLLLGITGSGKSATLKSMVLKQSIKIYGGPKSITDKFQVESVDFKGRLINVVDTPGFYSTRVDNLESNLKEFKKNVSELFTQFPEGFDALALVLSYGDRFGEEQAKMLKILKETFGVNWLRNHGVVVVTFGDNFKYDFQGSDTTFKDWCREQRGPMEKIFSECNYRCVLFDNFAEDQNSIEDQLSLLISVVDCIGHNQRYTLQQYNDAQTPPETNQNYLLLGITGSGKSATLRSMVLKDSIKIHGGPKSVTDYFHVETGHFNGRLINVIDTPGFCSTKFSDAKKDLMEFKQNVVDLCQKVPDGFALTLVLSYGNRFGEEEAKMITTLKEIFGENWLKNHGVVVVTYGDSFKYDFQGSDTTFKDWCKEQRGLMGQIFSECNHRCVLFDNAAQLQDIIHNQLTELISVVDTFGSPQKFTIQHYNDAQGLLSKMLGWII